MKRRNTIDCTLNDVWPICQYYYTHNNGSCDDILIQHRDVVNRVQIKQNQRQIVHKKSIQESLHHKRYTYPMPHHHKDKLTDKRKEGLRDFKARHHPSTARRWSTIRRQKQKRQTLANIITALSAGTDIKSSAAGSISKSDNNNRPNDDGIASTSKHDILDSKWASIRQYNPQLDNEKIEQEFNEQFDQCLLDEDYAHLPSMIRPPTLAVLERQQTKSDGTTAVMTTTTNMSLNTSNISIETTNQFLLNSSADQSIATTARNQSGNDAIFTAIPMPEENTRIPVISHSSYSSVSFTSSPFLLSMDRQMQHQKEAYNSSLDMWLFLFGFLFFPLWWFGAARYFMQQDKSLISTETLSFQVLNCYMTLVSLLLIGLMVGLVTVWA